MGKRRNLHARRRDHAAWTLPRGRGDRIRARRLPCSARSLAGAPRPGDVRATLANRRPVYGRQERRWCGFRQRSARSAALTLQQDPASYQIHGHCENDEPAEDDQEPEPFRQVIRPEQLSRLVHGRHAADINQKVWK